MKKVFSIVTILLVVCLLSSCVSYLGPTHITVKGFGDNRYIDHGGVRYHIVPEESQKGGYWYPNEGRGTVFLGNTKEKFYDWIVVSDAYLFDNGKGISYIHCGAYYYFPEGIYGFPAVEAANVDALIIGDSYITDRQIIEEFMALQEEKRGVSYSDLNASATWISDRITLYNEDFDLIRPFLVDFDGENVWVPVFSIPGYSYTKIPPDLLDRMMALIG